MALQFSDDGPNFPDALLDALLAGDVIFLCGAGISSPQLPDFKNLIERIYTRLSLEKDLAEKLSFEKERFEEVLGALSRRLTDPSEVVKAVIEELKVPNDVELSHHSVILRLSRDLNNRLIVITTNFDTLLEHALLKNYGAPYVRSQSFAGQALPVPGSVEFSGIIHIHGRIPDLELSVEGTPLVLTSSDYGDAYMRSGWTSRFLFDLVRCKTIVLLGYGAGDAPVRYFLNVLEADRDRFSELKQIYVLDGVESDDSEASARWSALAVNPISYRYHVDKATGYRDHSALWRDLVALADVIERPQLSRQRRAKILLSRSFGTLNDAEISEVQWLFKGRRDLLPIVADVTTDTEWFDFLQTSKLWSASDATWVIVAWISKNYESSERLLLAVRWLNLLADVLRQHLARQIRGLKIESQLWLTAWRLVVISNPSQKNKFDDGAFALKQILHSKNTLDDDLKRAVSEISPRLKIGQPSGKLYGHLMPVPPTRLNHIFSAQLTVDDKHGANELSEVLIRRKDRAYRLVALATAELETALSLAVDVEHIGNGADMEDALLPSVERHAQNAHRDGVAFLVNLLTGLFPCICEEKIEGARRFADSWKELPGRVGLRLWLFAAQRRDLYSDVEIINQLISIGCVDFWSIKRELPLLLRDRLKGANSDVVQGLEERILTEADLYYARFEIKPEQVDWRPHARDHAVWLLLMMLNISDIISSKGRAELANILERRPDLHREVIERDFFSAYSYDAHWVSDDPTKVIQAPAGDRLRIARELMFSSDFSQQGGWNAFCRSDPTSAFDTLRTSSFEISNAPLWNDFLGVLAFELNQKSDSILTLSEAVLTKLVETDDVFLPVISERLVNLLLVIPPDRILNVEFWLERLIAVISDIDDKNSDFQSDLYTAVINSTSGQLTQIILLEIERRSKNDCHFDENLLSHLRKLASLSGEKGMLACGALAHDAAFLVSIDQSLATDILRPRVAGDCPEGLALRTVLVGTANITVQMANIFHSEILHGVIESKATDFSATATAAMVVIPALSIIQGETADSHSAITIADCAVVFRKSSESIRQGALDFLRQWMREQESGVKDAWRNTVSKFLEVVWPKERKFKSANLTPYFLGIIVDAEDQFPVAFEQLRHYLAPFNHGHVGLHDILESKVAESFPADTLSLLWLVCGPLSGGQFYDLAHLLDEIVKADPDLEIDRRFQWLQQSAARY